MLFGERLNSPTALEREMKRGLDVLLLGWSLGSAPQLRDTRRSSVIGGLGAPFMSVNTLTGTKRSSRCAGTEVLTGWGMEHYKSAPI